MSGRVYRRKFDWDEARARAEKGENLTSIARDLGVTWSAVARVVRPEVAARMEEAHRIWQYGSCPDCGTRTTRRSANESRRCSRCNAVARATTVRETQLRCVTCREWKPDDAFPSDRRQIARRGRHRQCTACGTKARQAYRERRKVPCVECGKPALPPIEKRRTGSDVPRCRDCFHAWHAEWARQPEQREKARARAVARRSSE